MVKAIDQHTSPAQVLHKISLAMELHNEIQLRESDSEISASLDFDEDEMHDACGVFGIYAPELQDVARTISLALIALQVYMYSVHP